MASVRSGIQRQSQISASRFNSKDSGDLSYHFAFQGVKPAGFLRSEVRSSVRSAGGALSTRQSYLFEREMVSDYAVQRL